MEFCFPACEHDFVSVYNYHVIAGINVRSISGFVFSSKDFSNFGCHPSQHEAFNIYKMPCALYFRFFWCICSHDFFFPVLFLIQLGQLSTIR